MQRQKSRTRETLNLSTDADSSTDIFVSAAVQKGADSIFFLAPPYLPAAAVVAAVAAAAVAATAVAAAQD